MLFDNQPREYAPGYTENEPGRTTDNIVYATKRMLATILENGK
jgi:hypothetical protein